LCNNFLPSSIPAKSKALISPPRRENMIIGKPIRIIEIKPLFNPLPLEHPGGEEELENQPEETPTPVEVLP